MGGFAVVIDWDRPVDPNLVTRMMDQIPHRTTGGVRTHVTRHAVLAEGRVGSPIGDRPWPMATLGPLAIVADMRLFDTDRLRAITGGVTATRDLDDRHLLLAAYRRYGKEFLDTVDGDFAFVIWDDSQRTVLAVRDRFAVRPIFIEEQSSGLRMASEVKQLVAASTDPPDPDPVTIGAFIDYRFESPHRTFLSSIERLRPAHALVGSNHGSYDFRYWIPDVTRIRHDPKELPHLFRDQVASSVERRLLSSRSTVAQLSGGLDSPSIAAAAARLTGHSEPRFSTVSSVYTLPSIDESRWIDDIVTMHHLDHSRFVPVVGTIHDFRADMHLADGPFVDLIRDMNHETARIAAQRGAALAMTGVGGDEVAYQDDYLPEALRRLHLVSLVRGVRRRSEWAGESALAVALRPIRAISRPLTHPLARHMRQRRRRGVNELFGPLVMEAMRMAGTERTSLAAATWGGRGALLVQLEDALALWANEMTGAMFASHGVDLTHPYLDRELVEFCLSIDPLDLTYDGKSKTIIRQAFSNELPPSVLERREKTTANEYLEVELRGLRDSYRSSFPTVPPSSRPYVDEAAYRAYLSQYDRGGLDWEGHLELLRVWQLLDWIGQRGTQSGLGL